MTRRETHEIPRRGRVREARHGHANQVFIEFRGGGRQKAKSVARERDREMATDTAGSEKEGGDGERMKDDDGDVDSCRSKN